MKTELGSRKYRNDLMKTFRLIFVLACAFAVSPAVNSRAAPSWLDTTFGGGDGYVTLDFGNGNDVIQDFDFQSDGKIIAAGYAQGAANRDAALARFTGNGVLDTSFGTGGMTLLDIPGGTGVEYIAAVGVQSDDKIVVGIVDTVSGSRTRFAMARFNADGSLDTSYGGSGTGYRLVNTGAAYWDDVRDLVVQPDDKVVAVGSYRPALLGGQYSFYRFDTNGNFDTTFSGDGIYYLDSGYGYNDAAYGVGLLSNGNIVISGYVQRSTSSTGYPGFGMAAVDSSGAYITRATFGFSAPYGVYAKGLKVQADDKVVAVGLWGSSGPDWRFITTRTNASLALDTNADSDPAIYFNPSGYATYNFSALSDSANDVVIQPDGKIVTIGSKGTGSSTYDFVLIRYDGANGSLDTAFGAGGVLTSSFASNNVPLAAEMTPDGKILVGGYVLNLDLDFVLARYNLSAQDAPPQVSLVDSSAATADNEITEGEVTNAAVTQLTVSFNEDVAGADNASNYMLYNDNGDGFAGGTTCATGVQAGDNVVAVNSVGYDNNGGAGPYVATLDVNGGTELPTGNYRLQVCGTTSIEDLGGNKLDGDGNGAGGDDFMRHFGIDRTPPGFLDLVLNWNVSLGRLSHDGALDEPGSVTMEVFDQTCATAAGANTVSAAGVSPFTYSHDVDPSPVTPVVCVKIKAADAIGNETVLPPLLIETLTDGVFIPIDDGIVAVLPPGSSSPTPGSNNGRPTLDVTLPGGDQPITIILDPDKALSLCGPEYNCQIESGGSLYPTVCVLVFPNVECSAVVPGGSSHIELGFDPAKGGAGVGVVTDPTNGIGGQVIGGSSQALIVTDPNWRPTLVVTAGGDGVFTIMFTLSLVQDQARCGSPGVCKIWEDKTTELTTTYTPLGGGMVQYSAQAAFTAGQIKLYSLEPPADSGAPRVLKVNSNADTGDGNLQLGEIAAVNITSLLVVFSEVVQGGNQPNSAEYPSNFTLVSLANGPVAINSLLYEAATSQAILNLNGGIPLPNGSYQLTVNGSSSIRDLAGNSLDGNGDGAGGDDFILTFVVANGGGSGWGGPGAEDMTNSASLLPATGFAPGGITELPAQPGGLIYANTDLILEIPALNKKVPIVGVPQTENGWDVTWLGSNAGWLAGTAFPTWEGNTVITAHVWDAWNQPGSFADLKSLKYGGRIYIHAWGRVYEYEVRENRLLSPRNIGAAIKHEERDWITLITCEFYNPINSQYVFRRMVRAVLMEVK